MFSDLMLLVFDFVADDDGVDTAVVGASDVAVEVDDWNDVDGRESNDAVATYVVTIVFDDGSDDDTCE